MHHVYHHDDETVRVYSSYSISSDKFLVCMIERNRCTVP